MGITSPPQLNSLSVHLVPKTPVRSTLGGPIVKNKLFAFGGLFMLRSSQAMTLVTTVETPQFAQFVENQYPNNIS
jgi:hypothetical protein